MRWIITFIKLLANALVTVVEGLLWVGFVLRQVVSKIIDAVRGQRSFKDGVLHCPRDHEVATTGAEYECQECGYTYEGSIWQCANPECGATTPYINCPTCGLSIRNPYRWGRP